MKKYLIILILFPVFFPFRSWGQNNDIDTKKKSLEAFRTPTKPIIDGVIDELYFQSGTKADHFTTFEPVPGQASDYKTEVYLMYDDQSVYIAAMLYDSDPESIVRDLSPRDRFTNTDFFGIVLDPYQTAISGSTFLVSAAGVQFDAKAVLFGEDSSWNEIWKSKIKITDNGWVVEMEIPYSALRFPTGEVNDWNIQFLRLVRKTREKSFWQPVNPEVDGFLSQMATLKNVKNINAPLRLSVTPYVGLQLNSSPNSPISTKIAGGLDLKYGINEAFTLDMILIPDFSQVRSDVQVLNLSPFETRFDENRPFFTEGLELFNTANILYTRRIGGTPFKLNSIYDSGKFIKSIPSNNLVNATKISGRTNSNTGIGFFNAVESPTYAEVQDSNGIASKVLANPLTNYNVIVVEQALKNNSKIGIINTNVTRKGKDNYNANVTGVEWNLRTKNQKFDLDGSFTNSQKFYQKDDGGLNQGFAYSMGIGKISGKWNYRAFLDVESANYDPNDLGFLHSPNEQGFGVRVSFNQYKPKNKNIANYNLFSVIKYEKLFTPNVFTELKSFTRFSMRFKSFNAFGLWLNLKPFGDNDYFEPRRSDFSLFLKTERSIFIGGFFSTDYRKPFAMDIDYSFGKYDFKGKNRIRFSLEPRIRVNSKIFLLPEFQYSKTNTGRGIVLYEDIEGLDAEEDVLIGQRNVSSYDNSFSGQYNINNKMSISLGINHHFSSVEYLDFGVLQQDGSLNIVGYTGKNLQGKPIHNTNYNFFTVNSVYTWRFAPGSDLILSYKTNLYKISDSTNYLENLSLLGDFYEYSGLNLKVLYYLDINKYRKIK